MMKKALVIVGFLISALANAQLKNVKVGHIFNISVPSYMSKTAGLNGSAIVQFKNTVKDTYCIVVEDNKEDLKILEFTYTDTKEFFSEYLSDLKKDEENPKTGKESIKKVGNATYIEADLELYDKETKSYIYYLVGVVETDGYFYKVLSWTTAANKEKYKADFQKILYSIKE